MYRELLRMIVALGALALVAGSSIAAQDSVSCNMTLLSQTDTRTESYNDCWGYTAPNGDEYAIIGYKTGTVFYNVTDPQVPVEVGFISGPNSTWRDIKTYQNYCYIGTEGSGGGTGMQIVDLSDPENPVRVNTYNATFTTSHNLYIDTAAGRCYVVGASGGMHILDIATDPVNPIWLGSWGNFYIHDLYVENDTAYVGNISDQSFRVLDVSNPANIQILIAHTYASASTHNCWIHPDHNFLLTSDEAGRGHIRCWDISDPQNVTEVSDYKKPGFFVSAHNVMMKGAVAYISYYTEGTRVVDFSDPFNPVELGFYDTYTGGGGPFAGNWGVYPFLPSGTIVSSDMASGLFLTRYDDPIVTDVTSGNPTMVLPVARLMPNVPNPFNPATRIAYQLPVTGQVDLSIYDPAGRLVRTMVSGAQEAGSHTITWNGRDGNGAPASSGVYFYRLNTDDTAISRKLHLVR